MRKAINHLKKSDPVLAAIIKQVGPCLLEYRDPDFGTLVKSIVYQQLSTKVAGVILGRLLDSLPAKHLTPEAILKLEPEQMRALGLSTAKTAYIRDLAARTLAGEVVFKGIHARADDEVIQHLTQVKGIGVWTAHMFLIFALQRPDVLPVGDLGVKVAIRKAYGLEALPTAAEIVEIGSRWRPYCSIATWYLWRSLDGSAQI